MAGVGVVVVVLAIGLCAALVLYALVAGETSDPEIVDRETAERRAMKRGRSGDAESPADSPGGRDDRDDGRWGDGR